MARTDLKNLLYRLLETGLKIKRKEVAIVTWSFLYFFFLLSSYYLLRPIRDEMGIQGGVENLPWMFTGTFIATAIVVPIFGWIATHVSKRRITYVFYSLFLAIMIVFYFLMLSNIYQEAVAIAFFIFLSVFNLFVVSVFWSFMIDVYDEEQSERLFGFIAAGGTSGAILGPTLAATLPSLIGTDHLLLVSSFILLGTLLCINRILCLKSSNITNNSKELSSNQKDDLEEKYKIGGNFFDGITKLIRSPYLLGIGFFIVLYSATSTFVYFAQANILEEAVANSTRRTQIFALIDFCVNALTVLTQIFVTGRLMEAFGPGPSLLSLPVVTLLGFIGLAASPVLVSIVIFQVLRRSSNYALARPSREILFSPLTDGEKYKGKNVVDTLVYRGGDAATGWAFSLLQNLGFTIVGISLIGAGLAAGWILLSFGLIIGYAGKTQ